ncbi:hypothetical protein K501DRAFT_284105 [Backusella circina FSU 941]|nr:hypothetical protein K501DRAFT_284105 [Backusella circina FSU 941]
MLSAFEGDNYSLINKTIEPLRQLLEHGADFESLKAFQDQAPLFSSLLQTDSKGKGKQVAEPCENSIENHLDPSWSVINDKTVNITIDSTGTVIVAKSVTTRAELESLVSRMYEMGTAALDCEFIAIKNAPPQLQLLQVAVSATEGYAIVVDKVGVDALNTTLKPCLEDSKMNFVGWAFRGDALAIESIMKGIALEPILDLQAKLRPVAVEEMNLYAGVSGYASEWDALGEFQKAKLLGDSFEYHVADCIWLKDPLPPAALVYSVFDVVSLLVLLDSTKDYPTRDDHYWPFTITKTAGRKSLNNWYKQRALSSSSSIIDTKDLKNQNGSNFSAKRGYNKQRKSFNFSSQKEYNPDTQYKDDLQKAVYLSLQETRLPSNPGHASSSKAQDRVVDFDFVMEGDVPQRNEMTYFADRVPEEEEEPIMGSTWSDIVNEKQKPFLGLGLNTNQANSEDSKSSSSPVPAQTSEIQVTILKRPVEPVKLLSPQAQEVEPIPSSTTTTTVDASHDRQLFTENPKRLSLDSSNSSSNNSSNNKNNNNNTSINTSALFSCKPNKSSYDKAMKTGGSGVSSQTGVFGWDDDTYDGGGGKAWKEFAQTAKTGWSNNIDTDPTVMDEIKASAQAANVAKREEVTFNTSLTNAWHNKDVLSSNHNEWDVETERPTVMKMKIATHEIRKSKGPRCINPIDSDFSEDDSDETDSDDTQVDVENDKKSGNDDEKNSNNYSAASASTTEYYIYNEGQWSQWSKKNDSGNQYSRRSSYERNNNNNNSSSKPVRTSWSHSGDSRSTNNYNYNNNQGQYNNNNHNHNHHYNYNYNSNSNISNNWRQNNKHNNNNSNRNNTNWRHRNVGSSSQNTTPQPMPTKYVTTTTQKYDELEIYVNEFYTNTGDYIKLFKLTQPSHLDQIILPSLDTQFTVAITYHLIPSSNESGLQLKVIQFYMPNNDSFNVIIGQACHENSTEMTLDSKFNTLLTHPNINRVAWFPEYFEKPLKEKTGVGIGRVVDLGLKTHVLGDESCGSKFISVVNHYLKDWPSLEQFTVAKEEYDNMSRKKFVNTWDKEKIPDSTLEYSSLQGAALFKLYHHHTFSAVSDDSYIYRQK